MRQCDRIVQVNHHVPIAVRDEDQIPWALNRFEGTFGRIWVKTRFLQREREREMSVTHSVNQKVTSTHYLVKGPEGQEPFPCRDRHHNLRTIWRCLYPRWVDIGRIKDPLLVSGQQNVPGVGLVRVDVEDTARPGGPSDDPLVVWTL